MQMMQTFQPLTLSPLRQYFKLAPYLNLDLNLKSSLEARWIWDKRGAKKPLQTASGLSLIVPRSTH